MPPNLVEGSFLALKCVRTGVSFRSSVSRVSVGGTSSPSLHTPSLLDYRTLLFGRGQAPSCHPQTSTASFGGWGELHSPRPPTTYGPSGLVCLSSPGLRPVRGSKLPRSPLLRHSTRGFSAVSKLTDYESPRSSLQYACDLT